MRFLSLPLLLLALGCESTQPLNPVTPHRAPAWPKIVEGMSHEQVESLMMLNDPPFTELSKVTHGYETITTYGAYGGTFMTIAVDEHVGVVTKTMKMQN